MSRISSRCTCRCRRQVNMRIYFLRHGGAEWPDWDKPDDERPLNEKGRKEMERVAEFLADRGVKPDRILTSPLPRALQTAEIAAEALGMGVEEEPLLAHGFAISGLRKIVGAHPGEDLMVVGHEPSFSDVILELTGGDV